MYACARSVHSSVRVRTRLCVSAVCECARARRERRSNPSARPPNVCHYAHTYVCGHVYVRAHVHAYVCACRSHASVCARVSARGGSGGALRARDLQMCVTTHIHMYVGTSTCERMYMHMCVRVDPMQACARVLARAAGAATQPEVATSSYVPLCTYIGGYV
jgi:hypothetical protein